MRLQEAAHAPALPCVLVFSALHVLLGIALPSWALFLPSAAPLCLRCQHACASRLFWLLLPCLFYTLDEPWSHVAGPAGAPAKSVQHSCSCKKSMFTGAFFRSTVIKGLPTSLCRQHAAAGVAGDRERDCLRVSSRLCCLGGGVGGGDGGRSRGGSNACSGRFFQHHGHHRALEQCRYRVCCERAGQLPNGEPMTQSVELGQQVKEMNSVTWAGLTRRLAARNGRECERLPGGAGDLQRRPAGATWAWPAPLARAAFAQFGWHPRLL